MGVGLLSIPEEVLIYIATFLELRDLLACSATCSYLRSVLNDNCIWKRQYRSEIVDYVKQTRPLVRPELEYHKENDTLDHLCEERINLLRQNHMLNNWLEGRFVTHEANTPANGLFLENNDRQIIYDNIYLFLHVLNTNELNVWNIQEVPFLYTSVTFEIYEYNMEDEDWADIVRVWYQIVQDRLVIIQGNLIQVYKINLPGKDLPLHHLISVDRDEPVSDFGESLYTDCYSWIVGHLLFSRLCYLPVVHVWDILTGAKVKALRAPTTGWDLYVISLDSPDHVIFSLRTDDPFDAGPENYAKISNHISRYNVTKDEFETIFPNLTGCKPVHALQFNDFILLFCIDDMFIFKCSIRVYDCSTSTVKAEASFSDLVGLYKSRIVGDKLVLATQSSVDVLNIETLQTLQSLKMDDIIDIDHLPVFESTFLVTTALKNEVELTDIAKNRVLFRIPSQSFVFINESCSKLIVLSGQTLMVRSFW